MWYAITWLGYGLNLYSQSLSHKGLLQTVYFFFSHNHMFYKLYSASHPKTYALCSEAQTLVSNVFTQYVVDTCCIYRT